VNRPKLSGGGTRKEESSRPQLLEVLKEELFQLELDHQQGQVSDQEYAKAKAALDDTLARAIQRSRQTASQR
jgi:hypothetical protein